MQKKSYLVVILMLIFSIIFGGCFLFLGEKEVDLDDPSLSICFGLFDTKDGPAELVKLFVKQVKPETRRISIFGVIDYKDDDNKKIFFHFGLPKGSHQIIAFECTDTTYKLQKGNNGSIFQINSPGLYYMGSYKTKMVKKRVFFVKDDFAILPVKPPPEKEILHVILKHLIDEDEEEFTRHINMIRNRINKLNNE